MSNDLLDHTIEVLEDAVYFLERREQLLTDLIANLEALMKVRKEFYER